MDRWERTAEIYGDDAVAKFAKSRVAIFGVGGVGSYAAEAILRSGVGYIDVYDFDVYEYSNFNRQLYADEQTLGLLKVEAFRRHGLLVNPEVEICTYSDRLTAESISEINLSKYDYVVDAIDDIRAKIALIEHALKSKTEIVSAMGAGNKTRPELLEISDIYKTSVCPLARMIRMEARKRNLPPFDVVYSKEQPSQYGTRDEKKKIIGSTAFVPAVMGLIIAGKVINDIANKMRKLKNE